MNTITDISWWQLSLGLVVLIAPIVILWRFKTGLIGKTLIGVFRMIVQLLFVGYYLEYLFQYDNPWINLLWILLMVLVADVETLSRSELRRSSGLLVSIFIATFIGLFVIDFFFLKFVIRLSNIMEAQYLIPITGMILGNCLRGNIIGIHNFYYNLHQHQERYNYFLATGAARNEALFPFFRTALKVSISPTLATMATIGLVSLPGMMTGQMLSGSSPLIAIKYQIMIMLAIFAGTVLCVYLAILLSQGFAFTNDNNFDKRMLRDKPSGNLSGRKNG